MSPVVKRLAIVPTVCVVGLLLSACWADEWSHPEHRDSVRLEADKRSCHERAIKQEEELRRYKPHGEQDRQDTFFAEAMFGGCMRERGYRRRGDPPG